MGTIKQAEKDFGLGSEDYFKVKEGANKIRFMTEAHPHQSFYKGNKTFKFVGWVFDYTDNKVKLYFCPRSIYEAIGSFQMTEDYVFDEMPMPYDISINAKNAGTKEVEYNVVAARTNTPVPDEALLQMLEKKPIPEVLSKLKENEAGNPDKQAPADEPPLPTIEYGSNVKSEVTQF